ncbi:MAG TPA: hypothetical protein VEZ17_16745 [Chitinophagaceae bacterium]|jgi:hypothetical protein|nr:hypothetical protein [Chitinophagaceae bacterium]
MTQGFFDQTKGSLEISNTASQTVFQVKLAVLAVIVILITVIRFL